MLRSEVLRAVSDLPSGLQQNAFSTDIAPGNSPQSTFRDRQVVADRPLVSFVIHDVFLPSRTGRIYSKSSFDSHRQQRVDSLNGTTLSCQCGTSSEIAPEEFKGSTGLESSRSASPQEPQVFHIIAPVASCK